MIQFLNEHNLERKDYAEYAGTQDSIGNAEDSSCSHIYVYIPVHTAHKETC